MCSSSAWSVRRLGGLLLGALLPSDRRRLRAADQERAELEALARDDVRLAHLERSAP